MLLFWIVQYCKKFCLFWIMHVAFVWPVQPEAVCNRHASQKKKERKKKTTKNKNNNNNNTRAYFCRSSTCFILCQQCIHCARVVPFYSKWFNFVFLILVFFSPKVKSYFLISVWLKHVCLFVCLLSVVWLCMRITLKLLTPFVFQ